MKHIEWSSDGCPNDCGYCRESGIACIYADNGSPLKKKPYTCCKCGKKMSGDEAYSYKGFYACEDCFDDVISEVEEMIVKANEDIESRQIVKGVIGSFLPDDLEKQMRKQFAPQLEVQGKESIYEKKLREGKLL